MRRKCCQIVISLLGLLQLTLGASSLIANEGENDLNEVPLNFSTYYRVIQNNARHKRRKPNDSLGKNQVKLTSEYSAEQTKNEVDISPQNQDQPGTQKETTSSSQITNNPLGYGKNNNTNKNGKNNGSSKKKKKDKKDNNNGKKKKKTKRSKKKTTRPKSSKSSSSNSYGTPNDPPSNSPSNFPSSSPIKSLPYPLQLAVQSDLQMGLLGMSELTDSEMLIFEVQTAQHIQDFYNDRAAGSVFDVIAIVDVTDWYLEGNVNRRFLQGSRLTIKYNTEMTYRTSNPNLDPRNLVSEPFASEDSRNVFINQYLKADGLFQDVTGVSPIEFPQPSFAPSISSMPVLTPPTLPPAYNSPTRKPTNSPTSCEDGPEETIIVDFELALKSNKADGNFASEEEAQLEKTTLQYLQDNIGGECTFSVQSLEIVEQRSASSNSIPNKESNATVTATTAFSINATVSTKTSFIASFEKGLLDIGNFGSRRILGDICTSKRYNQCCISIAINNDKQLAQCKQWECPTFLCLRKDDDKDTLSFFENSGNSYYGENFAAVVSNILPVVDSAKSALETTASDLASCSATHDTIVVLRDFKDYIERVDSSQYGQMLLQILNQMVVNNCRSYTLPSLNCRQVEEIFCDDGSSESIYCKLPCNGIILPPTSFPTPKPTISSSSLTPLKNATYDNRFKAPRCFSVGRGCDSGVVLLKGRGFMSPAEPHAPNTIDGCRDGDAGTYHVDESIERVIVTSANGGLLTEATEALIEASVWVYSKEVDFADFYYAADATSPNWHFIKTVQPTITESLDTVSVNYTLPVGQNQAVRVVFRFGGEMGSCPIGSFDDVDDLVFAVVNGSPTMSPSPTLSPTITSSPTTTSSPITPSPTSANSTSSPINGPTGSPTVTKFPTTLPPTVSDLPTLTFRPSASPTHSMFPTVSSRAPVIAAVYDSTLRAPKC